MKVCLSILLPVYSETGSLLNCMKLIEQSLKPESIKEIILIVSPASDQTCLSICQNLAKESTRIRLVMQEQNPGLGWALRQGIDEARGTHVALMNSDGETDPTILPALVDLIESQECDIAVASRWLDGGGFVGYGRLKLMANYFFQQLMRVMFVRSLTEFTFVYRVASLSLYKRIRWASTGHEFALESILAPIRIGAIIRETPVRWVRRQEGKSKNRWYRQFAYLMTAVRIFSTPRSRLLKSIS
jgi:glycosyltransferase involved in cell wall biosynthesis